MILSNSLMHIYQHLLVGRLPVGGHDANQILFQHLYGLTGERNLHVYIQRKAGYLYFFAVESHRLTSTPKVCLPFAECLPGASKYQGDAVYLLTHEDMTAALLLEGSNIRFICNSSYIIQEELQETELPIIKLEPDTGPVMVSLPQQVLGMSAKTSRLVVNSAFAILSVATVVFLSAQVASFYFRSDLADRSNQELVQAELNDTLSKLSVQPPLARQIARLQQVSATTVRSGGWIENYKVLGEENETFEVILPSWVSPDYLDVLGRDVVTDMRPLDGLLVVKKGVK